MRSFLHEAGGGLDIVQAHILGAGDVDQHAVSAVDGSFHQGAGNGHTGGLLGLPLAGGMSDAHMGEAGILHNAGDIGKVKVDEAGVLDQIGNAGDRLVQHIVRDLKGVGQRDLLIGGKLQSVIGDDQQRIDLAEQLLNTGVGLIHAALTLKLEGLGHNADGKNARLTRKLSDRGGRAGAGPAAHTGGNKDHVRILKSLGDVVAALFGRTLADLGIGTCALAVGHLLADLDLLVGIGDAQRLFIGVDRDKLNALRAGLDHSVDNIVAGAADTNDL